jgi:isoprenylcysteine carboxyl methyltransferase (ICMT) family protein YpbQ
MKLLGLDTAVLFALLVLLVAMERGVELVLARRNAHRLLARGAIEVGSSDYRW